MANKTKQRLAIKSLLTLAQNLMFDWAVDGKIDDPNSAADTLEEIANQIRAESWKEGSAREIKPG